MRVLATTFALKCCLSRTCAFSISKYMLHINKAGIIPIWIPGSCACLSIILLIKVCNCLIWIWCPWLVHRCSSKIKGPLYLSRQWWATSGPATHCCWWFWCRLETLWEHRAPHPWFMTIGNAFLMHFCLCESTQRAHNNTTCTGLSAEKRERGAKAPKH